jgi:hypothetical protein
MQKNWLKIRLRLSVVDPVKALIIWIIVYFMYLNILSLFDPEGHGLRRTKTH